MKTKQSPKERLTTFLYVLLRDELTFGRLERLYKEHVIPDSKRQYSAPEQAAYAENLAERILGQDCTNTIEVEFDVWDPSEFADKVSYKMSQGHRTVFVVDVTEGK